MWFCACVCVLIVGVCCFRKFVWCERFEKYIFLLAKTVLCFMFLTKHHYKSIWRLPMLGNLS